MRPPPGHCSQPCQVLLLAPPGVLYITMMYHYLSCNRLLFFTQTNDTVAFDPCYSITATESNKRTMPPEMFQEKCDEICWKQSDATIFTRRLTLSEHTHLPRHPRCPLMSLNWFDVVMFCLKAQIRDSEAHEELVDKAKVIQQAIAEKKREE